MPNWIDRSGQTARHRAKAPLPTRVIIQKGDVHGKVINWGCGKDPYTKELCEELPHVERVLEYDPNISGKDTCCLLGVNHVLIVNYVLNVLPPKERADALDHMKIFGTCSAKYYFAVRGNEHPQPSWRKFEDGWLTRIGTFQKLYTEKQLMDELLERWPHVKILDSRNGMIIAVASRTEILI